jgi:hypothetical protein
MDPFARPRWRRASFNMLRVNQRYKVTFKTTANPVNTRMKLKFVGYQQPMGPGDRLGYLFEMVVQGVRRMVTMYRRSTPLIRHVWRAAGVDGYYLRSVRYRYLYRLGARGRDI